MAARTLTVAAVATAGLLALGGGSALAFGAGAEGPVTPVSLAAADTAPAPGVDRAAAERIATDRIGGGRITDETELDDDDDDGRQVWEVEVTNGTGEHDLDIDAANGAVVDHDIDDLRDGDDRDDAADDGNDDRNDRDDDGPQDDDRDDDRDDVRGDD